MTNHLKTKPMLLLDHTYGIYYPDEKYFWCTHGNWGDFIEILNGHMCLLFKKEVPYSFLESIPEDYNYTPRFL